MKNQPKILSGVRQRVVLLKGGFGGCSWTPNNWNEGIQKRDDGRKNRKEGTFAKTALLQNRPFVSSRFSCINFFRSRVVPTPIAGHPGHSLPKTTKAPCIEFLSRTSWGRGQGYPDVWIPDVPGKSCPKTLSLGCFFPSCKVCFGRMQCGNFHTKVTSMKSTAPSG